MQPKAFIFDLDFTLCHPVNRGPYGSGLTDEIIQSTKDIFLAIGSMNAIQISVGEIDDCIHMIILSGRKEKDHQKDTLKWMPFLLFYLSKREILVCI